MPHCRLSLSFSLGTAPKSSCLDVLHLDGLLCHLLVRITALHATRRSYAGYVNWMISRANTFAVFPATAPGISKSKLDFLFKPTLDKLRQNNFQYQYYSQEAATFFQSYNTMNAPSNASNGQIAGRLIPRSVVEKNVDGLVFAVRCIIEAGVMVVGISFNVAKSVPFPDAVAANPYWRQTMIHFSIGTFLNYQDFDANRRDQVRMTNEILPKLERLTPRGAAYLNEANYMQPDWQWVFYGPNYGKLNLIKAKYDPSDVFYALGAVGSDRWAQRSDGRLCRISG